MSVARCTMTCKSPRPLRGRSSSVWSRRAPGQRLGCFLGAGHELFVGILEAACQLRGAAYCRLRRIIRPGCEGGQRRLSALGKGRARQPQTMPRSRWRATSARSPYHSHARAARCRHCLQRIGNARIRLFEGAGDFLAALSCKVRAVSSARRLSRLNVSSARNDSR